jgi:hypothetical protein
MFVSVLMILKLFYDVNEQFNEKPSDLWLASRFFCVCAKTQLGKIYNKIVIALRLQFFTLGLLQLHIAFVASKAVTDQQTDESQVSNVQVAQQRIGDLGYNYAPAVGLPVEPQAGYDYPAPAVAAEQVGYPYPAPAIAEHQISHEVIHDDHHHHNEHDPGFWKKKVTWKEGWKKYWVSICEVFRVDHRPDC